MSIIEALVACAGLAAMMVAGVAALVIGRRVDTSPAESPQIIRYKTSEWWAFAAMMGGLTVAMVALSFLHHDGSLLVVAGFAGACAALCGRRAWRVYRGVVR